MTTLRVGIASYKEMKARTMAVASGERRLATNEAKVWFTSTESFAKVLSAGNRELLRVIAEKAPGSLDESPPRPSPTFRGPCAQWKAMDWSAWNGRTAPHHSEGDA